MRPVLHGLALCVIVWSATPASAQQGSIQVSGTAQAVTGDPHRRGGQNRLEPDLGIVWLQPSATLGLFQLEVRGARRDDRFHPGRIFVAIRERPYRGIRWSLEAGDTHFAPAIGEYKFANLFTPALTFSGAALTAKTTSTTVTVMGGRATAWRNIFGNDPQTLDQSIGTLRVTHKASERLEVSGRASRVRTADLREFSFLVESSDQAGGGARFWLTPSLQLAGDASAVSFVRVGSDRRERDVSAVAGVNWLHKRGWVQVNASRFPAGEFPTLNSPLPDRESVFVSGDYDLLPRVRVFGGWEAFRTNLDPDAALRASRTIPESSGMREFGGIRVRLASRTSAAVRVEQGARVSRPLRTGIGSDSDTGAWSADVQTMSGPFTTAARYAQRQNVDRLNGTSSYTQHDASLHLFATVKRTTQLFGSAIATRHEFAAAGGSTYWQVGGGAQAQVPRRDLWFRGELTVARNVDLLSELYVPRESLTAGVNGRVSRNLHVSLNVHVDRSPSLTPAGSPWLTRSTVRFSHVLPTGSGYAPAGGSLSEAASSRATGSIVGSVFADWNGDGEFDAGDQLLEGIAVMLGPGNVTSTRRDGQFEFLNVPTGARLVGLDTSAVPVDFEPPATTHLELYLSRGDTHRVAFPLVPLGTVAGRVYRDTNGNGRIDPGDEAIDGAVVVLDGGARSEQVRRGQFRFDAVRAGERSVRLLLESLPDGATISGKPQVTTVLRRGQMLAAIDFLVSIEPRPEVRRVFPSAGSGGAGRTPPPSTRTPSPTPAPGVIATPPAPRTSTAAPNARYVVQVGAYHNPAAAAELLRILMDAGLPAYIQHAGPTAPSPYRIRLGPFDTLAAAEKAARDLERKRGEKYWVTRER